MLSLYLKINIKSAYLNKILFSLIIAGIILSTFQLLFSRSLWLDEVAIARNLMGKDFFQLFQPLDHGQVAPIGFLMTVKFITSIFGYSEVPLRIFPFISYLISIILIYFNTLKMTKGDKLISLLSTSIFSLSITSIYYSSELKQYSSDILFAMLILNSVLYYLDDTKSIKGILYLTIVGVISIFFSNISIIILFAYGLYLFYSECFNRKNFLFLIPLFFWISTFLFYYINFINGHPSTELMNEYWKNNFLTYNLFSEEFYLFLMRAFRDTYGSIFGFDDLKFIPFILIIFTISMFGIYDYFKTQNKSIKRILYFTLSPLIIHLLLSGLQLYPYALRLILYLSPFLIILYANGLKKIYDLIHKKNKYWKLIYLIPILITFLPIALKYPIKKEEIKPNIKFIEANKTENETLYIYYAAQFAFEYYQNINYSNITDNIIYGSLNRDDFQKYNKELSQLSGKCYLLFYHDFKAERQYIINYLENNGSEILDTKMEEGSYLYYIDTHK